MIRENGFFCRRVYRAWKLFLVAVVPALVAGATVSAKGMTFRSTGQRVPACKLSDLDSKVSFFKDGDEFIVAFDTRNISEDPCSPDIAVAYPLYAEEQGQPAKPFGLCTHCDDLVPNGGYRVREPVVLNSGEFANQTYRWKTLAPDATVHCLKLGAIFTPVLTSAPALFPPVCSRIEVSSFHAGEYVPPESKENPDTAAEQDGEPLSLTSRKSRYFLTEMFNLHVGLATGTNSLSDEECPTLFLREKSPDGTTRFDEVIPSGFKACKRFWFGANRDADWQSGFEVDAGMSSRWSGIGEHSFELFQVAGTSPGGGIQFIHSNVLKVEIDDPALMQRKWHGKEKGVGVDLSLDKETFQVGEDVSLHIAIENFDAPVPIYAIDPIWDPSIAIGVEVRDSTGNPLAETEKFPMTTMWTGHGLGPFPYPPGKIVTIERDLRSLGWLPNRPGAYRVVVTWCPLDGSHFDPESGRVSNAEMKIYATVRATAIIRIVAGQTGAPHIEH